MITKIGRYEIKLFGAVKKLPKEPSLKEVVAAMQDRLDGINFRSEIIQKTIDMKKGAASPILKKIDEIILQSNQNEKDIGAVRETVQGHSHDIKDFKTTFDLIEADTENLEKKIINNDKMLWDKVHELEESLKTIVEILDTITKSK